MPLTAYCLSLIADLNGFNDFNDFNDFNASAAKGEAR
jgi:hypothetical protein